MKAVLQDLNAEELAALAAELGEPRYRAGQIARAISRGARIAEFSELPAALRRNLSERFEDEPVRIAEVLTAADGTEKYLVSLADGALMEGVLWRYKYGNT